MKTLYIFDMGGVVALNTDVFPVIVEHLGITVEEGLAPVKDLVMPLMAGNISAMEFWACFSARSKIPVHEELFGKFFHPERNEPVYALIRTLKARHRVVCGTNSIEEHYAIHIERGDYDVFDHVYASHRIGLAKPDPEFFRHILEREQASPDQAVFIDDALRNIETARSLGIEAYHFTDYDTLVRQMNSLFETASA